MSSTEELLAKIGESTAEAIRGVLVMFCPQENAVSTGIVSPVSQNAHPMDGVPLPSIATGVSYVDGVTGGNAAIMTVKGAHRLAAAMMGMELPDEADGELDEMEMSAVGEAMNQMMATAAAATSEVLGKEVEIAPPEIHNLTTIDEARNSFESTPHAVTISMYVLGEPLKVVQFIPHAFIVRMKNAISEMTTEYVGEQGDAPLSASVRDVPLRLWAELGRTQLPLDRLIGLPVGAVVELDRDVDDEIDLYVDDMPFATGRLLVTEASEWAVRIETVHGMTPAPTS